MEFISHPSETETSLIDSLYQSMVLKSYEETKKEILNIPKVSTFERINFYLFKKYTVTIVDGIERFEEKFREELKELCKKLIKYCKE